MEAMRRASYTRMLTDEYDLYYDQGDMFGYAQEGETWVEHWMCGSNRTLQVGDEVFLLDLSYRFWDDLEKDCKESYPDRGFFARGQLIAGGEEEQLRLLDSDTYGDLSTASCNNPWREDLLEEEREEILFVRFKLDSTGLPSDPMGSVFGLAALASVQLLSAFSACLFTLLSLFYRQYLV